MGFGARSGNAALTDTQARIRSDLDFLGLVRHRTVFAEGCVEKVPGEEIPRRTWLRASRETSPIKLLLPEYYEDEADEEGDEEDRWAD